MKRVLIALLTALPLTVGVASAQAATPRFPGFPGGPGSGSTTTQQAAVTGTVVSVDATAGTFVANAYVLTPPSMGTGGSSGGSTGGLPFGGGGFPFGGGGFTFGGGSSAGGSTGSIAARAKHSTAPTTTQVTITTNSSTIIRVGGFGGGMMGGMGGMGASTTGQTAADLVPGAKFVALFSGSPTATIQTLVASPATAVYAQVPKQFYAFVGTVSATSTTAGTIAVDVTRSLPSGLVAGGTSATFAVGSHTLIIGGSSLTGGGSGAGLFGGLFGGSLSDVSTGDMVAGGLIGNAGLTAAQVQATPLMFLLDLPAPTAGTSTTASAANKALKETMKVLHGAKIKVKHGKKSHGKSTKKAKSKSRAGRK
jgi:hypothetical protein